MRADKEEDAQPLRVLDVFRLWSKKNDPNQLILQPADLVGKDIPQETEEQWLTVLLIPDNETEPISLRYYYDPDRDDDGLTLILSFDQAQRFGDCAWYIPGARRRFAERCLACLPKQALTPLRKFGVKKAIATLVALAAKDL